MIELTLSDDDISSLLRHDERHKHPVSGCMVCDDQHTALMAFVNFRTTLHDWAAKQEGRLVSPSDLSPEDEAAVDRAVDSMRRDWEGRR
jgi:hypothetical protein